MKKVFIAGIKGGMGSRYRAILQNHLFIETLGCDPFDANAIEMAMPECGGVIIATPTSTHLEMMEYFLKYRKPILCEKPFTTDIDKLDRFEYENRVNLDLITMVNQYQYLTHETSQGDTYYDYFKSGGDGIAWDCLNLIGLAKGAIELSNRSAVWKAQINGQKLHLEDIDHSYISMVRRWVSEPKSNYRYASNAHRKVQAFLNKEDRLNARSHDWRASTIDEH